MDNYTVPKVVQTPTRLIAIRYSIFQLPSPRDASLGREQRVLCVVTIGPSIIG